MVEQSKPRVEQRAPTRLPRARLQVTPDVTHLHGLYALVQHRLRLANVRRRHGPERLLQGGLLSPAHAKRPQGRGSDVAVLRGRVHGEVVDPAREHLQADNMRRRQERGGGERESTCRYETGMRERN